MKSMISILALHEAGGSGGGGCVARRLSRSLLGSITTRSSSDLSSHRDHPAVDSDIKHTITTTNQTQTENNQNQITKAPGHP